MSGASVEHAWIDNVPLPSAVLDAAGAILAANAPFRARLPSGAGSAAGCIGRAFVDLVQAGDASALGAGVRSVLAGQLARYATEFVEPADRGRRSYRLEIVRLEGERAAVFLWELDAGPAKSISPARRVLPIGAAGPARSVHDFKNMLGVILGSADEILSQVEGVSPIRIDAEEIKRAAMRCVDLLADVLLAARRPFGAGDVASEPARTLGGSEAILLVEDDYRVRVSSVRTLRSMGYQVMAADSAREALDLTGQGAPPVDLLLSDVLLAGMSGAQLARHLNARYPDLRTLFMSGYSVESVREQLPEGFHGYLEKPFSPQELSLAVRQVLDMVRP